MSNQISVIIPTFNRCRLLIRALKSVLEQDWRHPLEVIVIDDGSNDQTQDHLSEFIQKYQGIHKIIIKKIEHSGVSKARNEGIKISSGQWLAFLDSDDQWLNNKIKLQMGFLKKNKDLCIVHSNEIWIRNGVRVNPKNIHKKSGGDIFFNCLPLCLISPSSVIIKKTLFTEVGLFREDFPVCEDYDMWAKITLKYPVGYIDKPLIIKYGGHADQLSRKYVAMDYYRIKSLYNIWPKLDPFKRVKVSEIIKTKGRILLNGYIKHNNLKNYGEIKDILDKLVN